MKKCITSAREALSRSNTGLAITHGVDAMDLMAQTIEQLETLVVSLKARVEILESAKFCSCPPETAVPKKATAKKSVAK